jgi:S-adenosylmethionine:tRNA ribosyltransferase-isomerase
MDSDPANPYSMDLYDYLLPEKLIAQTPCEERASSRMLVLDRSRVDLQHVTFEHIGDWLLPGDVLVVNDTRVVPARLHAVKETGGKVEVFVLDPYKEPEIAAREGYLCLLKASKPIRAGSKIWLEDTLPLTVLSSPLDGKAHVLFPSSEPLLPLLDRLGETPLPPYIRPETRTRATDDRSSYQTVYACRPGAVAAPTAGLHFTESLLDQLAAKGIERVSVTLHVGYGTFSPVRMEDLRHHQIHAEFVQLSDTAARQIQHAKRERRRIIAVGTTVVRVLEWVASCHEEILSCSGSCDHYIYPGYPFKVVDGMVTNFHLPRSSLLLLVSAFAGRERILDAYRKAIEMEYRFFSYGDAMLIL